MTNNINAIDLSQLELSTLINLATTLGVTMPDGQPITKLEILAIINKQIKPMGLMLVPDWSPYVVAGGLLAAYLIGNSK